MHKSDESDNIGKNPKKMVHTNDSKEEINIVARGTLNLQTPLKKQPFNEIDPIIITDSLINLLLLSYDTMEKNIKNLKDSLTLFGIIDPKTHTKYLAEIIAEMEKFQINENFKPKICGILSLNRIILILTSTMLGYIKYLKYGMENYKYLEKNQNLLVSKLVYGLFDLMNGCSTKKLKETLNLMARFEFKDNCPLFAKISHDLIRIFINLTVRNGLKGERMTNSFKEDIDFLNVIIQEENPEHYFTHIEFVPDFMELLKAIACTNKCLQFYHIVNNINKQEHATGETTRSEIIKIIDLIIKKKCYFTRSFPYRAETLYTDEILINENMKNYTQLQSSKLDLIFTLLHEITHIKRINFSFDGDHLSKTPKEFMEKFENLVEMTEEEKNRFWDPPEIGESLELVILGSSLYKYRSYLILDEKYCFTLINPLNWNSDIFKEIDAEISKEIKENPQSSERMSFKREFEYLLRCNTHLDLKQQEDYDLIFNIH